MNNNEFTTQTIEELQKRKKTLGTINGIFAGMLLFLLIATLYRSLTNEFDYLLIVPLALSPLVIRNFKTLNKITKELKSRE